MVLAELTLAFGALFVLLFFQLMSWPAIRTVRLVNRLDGPSGLSLVGIVPQFSFLKNTELLDFLKSLIDKYPRLTSFWVMGIPCVIIQEPEDLEVLMGSSHHITKGMEYAPIIQWLNEGLLTSSGNKWHTRRKMLTNAFHFKILEDALPTFNKNGMLLVDKLYVQQGKTIDVDSFIRLCTLDIICEAAMGVSLGAQNNQGHQYVNAIKRANEIIVKRILSVWIHLDWIFYMIPTGIQFSKLLKIMYGFSNNVINDKRRAYYDKVLTDKVVGEKSKKAFLDTLLEVEMNNPQLLTQTDIREEVDTFMFEGHDTTSTAIVFSLFLLGLHPEIQEKAAAEMYEIFGDSDRGVEKRDLQRMVYLEMIIKESLRLFPSVPYISRLLTEDLLLHGDVLVPSGCNMIIVPYFIHRNPRFFRDPEVFDPERFADDNSQKRNAFSYIPFSAGPRNCIGQKFAMMELKVILSWVLRKSVITSVTKMEDIKLLPLVILRPNIPIKLKIKPRVFQSTQIETVL